MTRVLRKRTIRAFLSSQSLPEANGRIRLEGRLRISAPPQFTLISAPLRTKMLRFLERIRKAATRYKAITLDLAPIKRLSPCGTLLFVAEINRLLTAENSCRIRATRPSDAVVEELFQHIGLLRDLKVRHRLQVSHERVRNWTFHYGTRVDLSSLDKLKQRLDEKLGEDLAFDLMSAVGEAITNSVHHAYIEPRGDNLLATQEGWWLFAESGDNGVLHVSVCDLGIGIRRTLPLAGTWAPSAIEAILQRLGANTSLHAKHIKAALELGATRTGASNRGKGLHEMLELVKNTRSGGLRIFSDRGMYTYSGKTGTEKILDYPGTILGTLVQWTFDTKSVNVSPPSDA